MADAHVRDTRTVFAPALVAHQFNIYEPEAVVSGLLHAHPANAYAFAECPALCAFVMNEAASLVLYPATTLPMLADA